MIVIPRKTKAFNGNDRRWSRLNCINRRVIGCVLGIKLGGGVKSKEKRKKESRPPGELCLLSASRLRHGADTSQVGLLIDNWHLIGGARGGGDVGY